MKFNYFYVADFYNKDQCQQLNDALSYNIDQQIPDVPAKNVVKTVDVGIVPIKRVKDYLGGLTDLVKQINREGFGFNLYDTTEYDTINYNEYTANKQGEYGWHTDFPLHNLYHLKLTVLVNLSTTEYTGGTFETFSNGPKQIKEFDKPGSVLIFPSWTPHRVTPVTSGKRTSMALFIAGPKIQ